MKRLILCLIAVLVLSVPAYAGIALTLKNGNTLKWENYTEENNQYCTQKNYGKMCIPKSSVVSVKGADVKEEIIEKKVIVIPTPSKDDIENQTTQRDIEIKKWKEDREKQEKIEEAEKKEAAEKERIIRIEEEKAEAAQRSARAAEDSASAAKENADATRRRANAAEDLNDLIRSRRRY